MNAANDAQDATRLPGNTCGSCRRWIPSAIGWSARFGQCEVRPGTVRTYTSSESRCDVNHGAAFVPLPSPKVPA